MLSWKPSYEECLPGPKMYYLGKRGFLLPAMETLHLERPDMERQKSIQKLNVALQVAYCSSQVWPPPCNVPLSQDARCSDPAEYSDRSGSSCSVWSLLKWLC